MGIARRKWVVVLGALILGAYLTLSTLTQLANLPGNKGTPRHSPSAGHRVVHLAERFDAAGGDLGGAPRSILPLRTSHAIRSAADSAWALTGRSARPAERHPALRLPQPGGVPEVRLRQPRHVHAKHPPLVHVQRHAPLQVLQPGHPGQAVLPLPHPRHEGRPGSPGDPGAPPEGPQSPHRVAGQGPQGRHELADQQHHLVRDARLQGPRLPLLRHPGRLQHLPRPEGGVPRAGDAPAVRGPGQESVREEQRGPQVRGALVPQAGQGLPGRPPDLGRGRAVEHEARPEDPRGPLDEGHEVRGRDQDPVPLQGHHEEPGVPDVQLQGGHDHGQRSGAPERAMTFAHHHAGDLLRQVQRSQLRTGLA